MCGNDNINVSRIDAREWTQKVSVKFYKVEAAYAAVAAALSSDSLFSDPCFLRKSFKYNLAFKTIKTIYLNRKFRYSICFCSTFAKIAFRGRIKSFPDRTGLVVQYIIRRGIISKPSL